MPKKSGKHPAKPSQAKRPRPYFVPASVDYLKLPKEVRKAFFEILSPAYAELVLGAEGALAQSAGATLVYLLALEILDQFELGVQMNRNRSATEREDRDATIARHLRLVSAKMQVTNFLARLEIVRTKFAIAQQPEKETTAGKPESC